MQHEVGSGDDQRLDHGFSDVVLSTLGRTQIRNELAHPEEKFLIRGRRRNLHVNHQEIPVMRAKENPNSEDYNAKARGMDGKKREVMALKKLVRRIPEVRTTCFVWPWLNNDKESDSVIEQLIILVQRQRSRSGITSAWTKSMNRTQSSYHPPIHSTNLIYETALSSLEQAAKPYPRVAILNKFLDEAYNRVGYTLVSEFSPTQLQDYSSLRGAVVSMVKAALETIDLESHCGTHPRLGIVDHICFHPLAQTSLDQTAWLARSVAADTGYNLEASRGSRDGCCRGGTRAGKRIMDGKL
ncbi:hypothetical protein IFM89_025220 [Coptis chinensis]|uniref:Formiminotransferase N-terminal subdomain domain-containing protein n=1 Tax=Coptis chinensis TaxID=261450 RepID=A0A835LCJ7_9MAGN|nr:hypothetical protein IFM89_025220 [Coptis chinensis]